MLFSFRSHYLFAIGLETIFNLRRSTPASLHSTLKLCDLWNKEGKRQGSGRHERDDSPLWWNFSERLFYRAQTYQPSPCTTIPRNPILSSVDSRGGLSFTRVTRCYHGYNSCCIFLPLLICLSSGRASALQRWLLMENYQQFWTRAAVPYKWTISAFLDQNASISLLTGEYITFPHLESNSL